MPGDILSVRARRVDMPSVTPESPRHESRGQPFSVPGAEVRELHGRDWDVATLECSDVLAQQPGFVAETAAPDPSSGSDVY
jgi:hypothetical protein